MSSIYGQLRRIVGNLKLLKRIIMALSWITSNAFPKKDDLIVFSTSLGKFAHNSKYMFLELNEQNLEKELVWITDDQEVLEELDEKGYDTADPNSIKSKYLLLRAGYVFFDNYSPLKLNSWLYLGSKRVNLWHGFPYKDIAKEESQGKIIDLLSEVYHKLFYKPNYFLETSGKYLHLYKRVFRESNVVHAGYPRNDIFYNDIEGSDLFSEGPPEGDYIVYMPTYRRFNEEEGVESDIDLEELDRSLDGIEMDLVIKPHHRFEIEGEFDNIIVSRNNLDPYLLLKNSEALISDYSSVIFDYMHTENPIIRYQYDKREYEEKRGLNPEIEKIAPGREVESIEGLKKALHNLEEIDTDYQEKINEVFKRRKEGLQGPEILKQIRSP